MIENTNIEQIINRCYTTWVRNLGAVEPYGEPIEPYDRGRESDGTFKADDLSTSDVNEAWLTGKSPRKKATRKKRKSK